MRKGGNVLRLREFVEEMQEDFLPLLPPGPRSGIKSSLESDDDIDWAFDCMLQDALVHGVPYPPERLKQAEEIIRSGGLDPELEERSLGWIEQHKALQDA